MKKYILNKLLVCGIFAISSIVAEMFLFIYLGFGVLPTYFLFDLSLILFVSFIVLFMPQGKGQNILIGIMLFLQIILSYTNICIYKALGSVFTFDMLSLVEETARVITIDMFPLWPLIFYVVLYALTITTLVIVRKKLRASNITYRSAIRFILKDIAIVGLTLSFALYSLSIYTLKGNISDDFYLFSDKVLYNNFSSSKQALTKFGTWGYYTEEFFRRFYHEDSVMNYSKNEILAYVNNKEYDPTKQKLYNIAKKQNILVLMLESFEWYPITEELTPTLYALANGYDFGTRDPEAGLYSNFDYYEFGTDSDGKTILIRKDYTKNSAGEYTKVTGKNPLNSSNFGAYGLTLTNYYSKSKTDYSEASLILGNYPYNQSFTTHGGLFGYSSKKLYSNVNYCFTLPNKLKSSGAVDVTNYMHSYISSFYGRDKLIPQFGFDNELFLDKMNTKDIETGDSLSHIVKDSEVIDYYLNHTDEFDFLPTDKTFLSFYTTVTTHGEYSYNALLKDNYAFLDAFDYFGKTVNGVNNAGLSEDWAEMVRNYYAKVLDTEHMVTLILKYLMENDIFDNTTLVMFSDHQCYYDGMDVNYKNLFFTDDVTKGYSSPKYWERDTEYGETFNENSQDRYLVPAMIYSTKITDAVVGTEENAHFIDKFTCAFDLTVTIFNMLGVDYNPSYYLGYTVFCETTDKVSGETIELKVPAYISCTGGIFNDKISTEDGLAVKYCKSDVDLNNDLQVFSYNVTKYIDKWYKITYLYELNMFK